MEGNKNAWKDYRSRWCYYEGKKIKLRNYIYVSANRMLRYNKKGWQKIDHVQNYRRALNLYGFDGIKIYEDYYYKDIPFPENQTFMIRLGLKLAPIIAKIYNFLKRKR